MTLASYGHVIEELGGTERRPAEAVIRDAREKVVSKMRPPAKRQPEGIATSGEWPACCAISTTLGPSTISSEQNACRKSEGHDPSSCTSAATGA
jgi:hypothetical protein